MIANFMLGEEKEIIEYELVFDDGAYNGYVFPCDKDGNLDKDMHPNARENYEWCIRHPEKFVRANKIVRTNRTWKEPNKGTCSCGEEIWLTNDYLGACECPKCEQWYNIWGQELLPPDQWQEDY